MLLLVSAGLPGAWVRLQATGDVAVSGRLAPLALNLKAGLDAKQVAKAIGGGAAGSWVLDNRSGNMVDNSYPLGFRVRLHHKDLKIALEAARELGVALPATALVDAMETGLIGRGFGDEDVSAIARTVRELSGLE